jgi:hypothetical protein
MKIILKDTTGKYKHLVTLSPKHLQIKKQIKDAFASAYDVDGNELAPTKNAKFNLLMDCLKYVESEIDEQLKSEFFNIVRIFTVIDDLNVTFRDSFENELARAFANEAIRLLMTQYGMKEELYTAVDYGRLDLYSAYPVHQGVKQRVQLNDMTAAATSILHIHFNGRHPSNFEYLKFGKFAQLKDAFYSEIDTHDKDFVEQETSMLDRKQRNQTIIQTPDVDKGTTCCVLF